MDIEEKTERLAKQVGLYLKDGQQRIGQAYFNALHRIDPKLADQIRSSDDDPFYRNDRIRRFLQRVYAEWDLNDTEVDSRPAE